jgi:hypothetical protein
VRLVWFGEIMSCPFVEVSSLVDFCCHICESGEIAPSYFASMFYHEAAVHWLEHVMVLVWICGDMSGLDHRFAYGSLALFDPTLFLNSCWCSQSVSLKSNGRVLRWSSAYLKCLYPCFG